MHQLEPKASGDQLDTKKEEALWELFTTECTYLLDHLQVLKTVGLDFATISFPLWGFRYVTCYQSKWEVPSHNRLFLQEAAFCN